jgi:hypothetical protein
VGFKRQVEVAELKKRIAPTEMAGAFILSEMAIALLRNSSK